MYCPKCRHENIPTARFCQECGGILTAACVQCGTDLPATARFCPGCGTPRGGAPPTLQERFSLLQREFPNSFHSEPMTPGEGENRLVTVLFTDMSRFVQTTRDLRPEEAATLVNRLVQAMMDVLLKYEGWIHSFLGDGLLAVFGVPHVRESDPERAILAALEIRAVARQLGQEVKAGINTGEVYLGGMGTERQHVLTVMGLVVSLAHRMMLEGQPGQILVGEATHRQTLGSFAFVPQSLSVKGIDEPLTAYSALRALPRREKARGIEGLRADLVGREAELSQLHRALDDVRRGRGQIVSLVGEAGVGKSRLVAELKALASSSRPASEPRAGRKSGLVAEQPIELSLHAEPGASSPPASALLWLEGRCLEPGLTTSYSVFVDLLHGFFSARAGHGLESGEDGGETDGSHTGGHADSSSAAGHRSRLAAYTLAASLREMVEQGGLTGERAETMLPFMANLLSAPLEVEGEERLRNASPEQIKHQTVAAVHDFLLALAQQQPVVLVLEDLHWVDSQSLDLVTCLMESVADVPLLLLCVYRPEPEHPCGHLAAAARGYGDRYHEVRLEELTLPQSRLLAESLLAGNALPCSVWEMILEKARGNPFFVEEVVRSRIASGLIYREADLWRAREEIQAAPVPETIQSVIRSHYDRLDWELRQVLQYASVMGRVFRPQVLELLVLGKRELPAALRELERHGLIHQERGQSDASLGGGYRPEAEYAFRHALTQETVYETMLRRRRAALHQHVAEVIEALYPERLEEFYEELARHYSLSDSPSKAVEYLLRAGRKALRLYANQEAVHYFERALHCLGQLPPDQHDVRAERAAHEGLGELLFRTGDHAGAEARFQMALNLASDAGEREFAALAAKLADAVHWQSQPKRAMAIAEAGLSTLGEDLASPEGVSLLELMARSSWAQDDREGERRYADQLREVISRVPYFDSIYMSYYALAWVEVRARHYDTAEQWLRDMEQVCSQHHSENGLARCYHGLGDLWRTRGDHQQACDWFEKSLACCERTGDAHLLLEGHLERAYSLIFLDGDPNEIDQHTQRGLSIARDMAGARAVSSSVLCGMLGDAWTSRGELEKARLFYHQALEFGGQHTPQRVLGELERVYARQDRDEEFRAFCRRARTPDDPLKFWHLTPGTPRTLFSRLAWEEPFRSPALQTEWQWIDPGGRSSWELLAEKGLLLMRTPAAPGQAHVARMAPGLLRPVTGGFALETRLIDTGDRDSHTAGLCLRAPSGDYVFFGQGDPAIYEIRLEVRRQGQRQWVGRGWLPGPELSLRLERREDQVTALCSNDGRQWHCCGEVAFDPGGDLAVGLCVACPTPRLPGAVARFGGVRLLIPEVA